MRPPMRLRHAVLLCWAVCAKGSECECEDAPTDERLRLLLRAPTAVEDGSRRRLGDDEVGDDDQICGCKASKKKKASDTNWAAVGGGSAAFVVVWCAGAYRNYWRMNEKLEKQSKIIPLVQSGLETPLPLPQAQVVDAEPPQDPSTQAVGARALPVAQVVAAIPGPRTQLVVAASPGPLGVHFKAGTAAVAELSPGSQLAGEVEVGDVLESVNGRPATAASLAARRGVLEENDDGETPRTLVFARPDRRFAVHAAPGSLGVVFAPGTTRVGRAPERGSVLGPARSQLFGFVDEGDALLSVNGRPAAAASLAEGGLLDEEDDGARARLLVFERGPKQRNELSPNVEFVVRAKPGPLGVVFKNRPIFGNGRCVDSVSSRSQLLNRVACWDELAFVNGKPATEESLAAARGILEEEDDGRTERVLVFRCLRATGAGPGLRGTAPPEGSGKAAIFGRPHPKLGQL